MDDLPADVRALRDRVARDVEGLYDDYTLGRALWRLLRAYAGRSTSDLVITNPATGRQFGRSELVMQSRTSMRRHHERAFKEIVGRFEFFALNLMRLWVIAHPEILGGRELTLNDVLRAGSVDALVDAHAEKFVRDRAYGQPTGWFKFFARHFKRKVADPADIASFAEIKAARDALEHAGGIVTSTYLSKAKSAARLKSGDRVSIDADYLREAHDVVLRLIRDLSAAAEAAATHR